MDKTQKIYVQDLNSNDSGYRKLLLNYACTNCGLIPHYELGQILNGGFDIKFMMAGWDRVNNEVKCPQCMRRIK